MGDGGPNLWCANTIEELLGYLGMEARCSRRRWPRSSDTTSCHAGADTDFGRMP